MAQESSDDFSDIDTPPRGGKAHDETGHLNEEDDEFNISNERTPMPMGKHPMQTKLNVGNDDERNADGNLDELTPMSQMTNDDPDDIASDNISPLNYANKMSQNVNNKINRQHGAKKENDMSDIVNDDHVEETGDMSDIHDQSEMSSHTNFYYNPRHYDGLKVNNELKRLFQYIEVYKPIDIELETILKPFIPDYIPSIGNVDGFIKPSRPDSQSDNLGLISLDEPILQQSDSSTLDLQLRSMNKKITNLKYYKIASIKRADKNPSKITNWIKSVQKIHTQQNNNNNQTDGQTKLINNLQMPDLEQLMQPWDTTMDEYFRSGNGNDNNDGNENGNGNSLIPPADIKLSINEYATIICNIFDIPVYNDNVLPSLHCLFKLYAMFKESNHIK